MTDALIVIDVQNDFCPGGALAVDGGDEIVPGINRLIRDFPIRVFTQDWHPAGHSSFASSHPGKAPLEMVDMDYGPQVLWPDHCVQGTDGAAFHEDLMTDPADLILRKGFRPEIEALDVELVGDPMEMIGRIDAALTEMAALPESAKSAPAMAGWLTRAQTYADAKAALNALSAPSN